MATVGRMPARTSLIPLLTAIALLAVPAAAGAASKTTFKAKRAGEAFLRVRALAPGADWGRKERESAVVTIKLDGRYNQDVVLFNGAKAFDYKVALGPVSRGRHKVTASYNRAKSPSRKGAKVKRLRASVSRARGTAALVQRYAPILYGRNLPTIPGAYENVNTDVPLLLYHVSNTDAQGNRVIEYTMTWSNEDGGTNSPSLMARWGRTTDIEWLYRVTVNADGNRPATPTSPPGTGTQPFERRPRGRSPAPAGLPRPTTTCPR